MDRVKQTVVTYDNDKEQLLAAIEEAMWHVNAAMDDLRGYGEFEEWFDTLDDMLDEMESEQEPLERYAEAEYRREMDALNRQYESDLL